MPINFHTVSYPFTPSDLKKRIDYDGGSDPVYVGYAAPGTAEGSAAWQIQKITYTGGLVTGIDFAGGTNDYNRVWDDRASYTYS